MGGQLGVAFSGAIAAAGDIDQDGYDDVVIGAGGDETLTSYLGGAYVFRGTSTGLSASPAWSFQSDQGASMFGASVSCGDVNGDGHVDLLICGHTYDHGEVDEGRAWLYLGTVGGFASTPSWSVEADQSGANLGGGVIVGDINGDGRADAVLGAHGFDNGQLDEGRVFVYLGSPCGLSPQPVWTAENDDAGSAMGIRVAGADVNGDGFADVLAGAYLYGPAERGRAYAFYGHQFNDCNTNGVDDAVDLSSLSSLDCNGNSVPDECDIGCTSTDANANGVPDECDPTITAYCFGDGTGSPCPCGNSGASGHGCGNSANASGAVLTWSGNASIANDTLVLHGSGMPSNATPSAIYIQGTEQDSLGIGTPVQDGLRCVIGNLVRLGTRPNPGGQSQFPDVGTPSISVRGGVMTPGTYRYQVYYRNAAAAFCPPGTANWTNGVEVPWWL